MNQDFILVDEGSVVLLTPISNDGRAWTDQHIQEDATWWGRAIVIDWRFADAICEGIISEGLNIARSVTK